MASWMLSEEMQSLIMLCKLFGCKQFLFRISCEAKSLAFGCPQIAFQQMQWLFGYNLLAEYDHLLPF
jgi:hypothetical protein